MTWNGFSKSSSSKPNIEVSVAKLQLGEITVDVIQKDIKNLHLSVYPPTGAVRISAPLRMKLETIRLYAISKLGWIKQHQKKLQGQERESPREYLNRESHYVWGKRYLLKRIEGDGKPRVELKHSKMVLHVRPGIDEAKKKKLVEAWYREQIRATLPPLIAKWENTMGVKVERFFVQRMKTRWGSCNHKERNIRLNTDLAKKPRECLEYIIVHEMVHLLEPTHNAKFITHLDRLMPKWRRYRAVLNELPVV